jgi:hypothetical protein
MRALIAFFLLSTSAFAQESYPAALAVGSQSWNGSYDPSFGLFDWNSQGSPSPWTVEEGSNCIVVHQEGPYDDGDGAYIIQVTTVGILWNESEFFISVNNTQYNPSYSFHPYP